MGTYRCQPAMSSGKRSVTNRADGTRTGYRLHATRTWSTTTAGLTGGDCKYQWSPSSSPSGTATAQTTSHGSTTPRADAAEVPLPISGAVATCPVRARGRPSAGNAVKLDMLDDRAILPECLPSAEAHYNESAAARSMTVCPLVLP